MIRALVVDDSVVVRRMLSDALASDPRITVAGTAPNGSIALQKLSQLAPDIVILDVEMPDMDGIETVKHLRRDYPSLPVIMCSALTERGADVTLRALAAGATDYVTKPTAAGTQAEGLAAFRQDLISRVIAFTTPRSIRAPSLRPHSTVPATPSSTRDSVTAIAAIGIGCSTGGPSALRELFSRIPNNLPVPVFIVQHMPPLFTRTLAESLSVSSGLVVREAEHGGLVEPGRVYIAPGDYHLVLGREGARAVTLLNQAPPENSCRPAVDVLFRSLATFYGRALVACVLTGMGHDGTVGAEKIVAAGGRVLVQSPETCVVSSMPKSVVSKGFAEAALPLNRLADQLVMRARRAGLAAPRVASGG